MKKSDLINVINEKTREPINELKKEIVGNSDGHNYLELNAYNALLDNISFGCHTKHEVEYMGHVWKMRPLSAEELVKVELETQKLQKENDAWSDFYRSYLIFTKTLALALSPSPFKIGKDANGQDLKDSDVLTENDLKKLPFELLSELYKQYLHFINTASNKDVIDYTDEELHLLLDTVKKNSIPLTALERRNLLIIADYGMSCSRQLERMLTDDLSN
jgi:hypothetical protein